MIYNEDCMKTMADRLGDEVIDLTLTSPPYGNMRLFDGNFSIVEMASELYRITKPGGTVVWQVDDVVKDFGESLASFQHALAFKDAGFRVNTMIYVRNNPPPTGNMALYRRATNYTFVLFKGRPKTINLIRDLPVVNHNKSETTRKRYPDGTWKQTEVIHNGEFKVRTNVWGYNVGGGLSTKDEEAYAHPSTFPEAFAKDHILSWSNEGDIVYDPFMGSGTTAKIATIHKRKCIGSEISKEYYDLAIQRLVKYKNPIDAYLETPQ